eukprot:GEMP01010451.1.p1 GENE.GEMP01010451.1~~GEMP01010451.1.p1  ORF type:complete len:262 (+),score=53.36 GEMP01010451.1:158-943(+)
MSDNASSMLKMSSVSSDDSLPLGCEHKEYYWIKRYRALKRKVHGRGGDDGEEFENDSPTLGRRDPTGARLRRLPCTRFYFEERQDDLLPYIRNLLGYPSETVSSGIPSRSKIAMLRTQQTLVISPVQSRWFVVDVTRPMRLLIGATSESSERLQPQSLSCMKIIPVDLKGRGDRVKLLVTPSLGYGPEDEPDNTNHQRYCLKGDFAVFVNDKPLSEIQITGSGQPGITPTSSDDHYFTADETIFGVAIWAGNLSDVKLVEQ